MRSSTALCVVCVSGQFFRYFETRPTHMQRSPYEIKEKLLQALDNEYNVLDMDATLDVIAALEKVKITKEALERTRIGKYINELRKRTSNKQLARRAKALVKGWRQLLPETPKHVNGEENRSIVSSPGGITVLGPGPGLGIGPGPGPGNRMLNACILVPGKTRYKPLSPSVMVERSSSPYYSSASNSPILSSAIFQGSNLSLSSNYAPVKLLPCAQTLKGETNSLNKALHNSSNQSKSLPSNLTFKIVSPSVVKDELETSDGTCALPSRTSLSTSPGPDYNSNSSSPSLNTCGSVCPQNISPSSAISENHSSLNIAKTNVANKRLRIKLTNCTVSPSLNEAKVKIGNGMSEFSENVLPCENSIFKSVSVSNSNSVEDKLSITTKTPKRKRSFDDSELQDKSGDLSKLPKVKTTQQIIADLHAKKGNTVFSPESSLTYVENLHSSEAEVSRTKSELLKKFLIASQSARSESPVDESSVSIISDFGSHSVPDNSSVINTNLDVSSRVSYPDPVDEEIKTILLALPPINPAIINLEESVPIKQSRSIEDDLEKLHEPWDGVNGVYDCNGTWRPWVESTEQRSYQGESIQILPYVNID